MHEKYRAKKVAEDYEKFKDSFNNAITSTPEIKAHVNKAQEDMNPLRVLNLFKAITDEVSIKKKCLLHYVHDAVFVNSIY